MTEAPDSGDRRSTRSARALIGWMTPQDAESMLAGQASGPVPGGSHAARARAARETVAARPGQIDQSDLVLSLSGSASNARLPDSLAAHLDALRAESLLAGLFASGWEPALVDLSRICAAQPYVHTDEAGRRFADLDAAGVDTPGVDAAGDDPQALAALAAISLPRPAAGDVSVQFDPVHNAWIFSGRNPNLRVLSKFQGPAAPGTVGVGFVVGVVPSVIQVAVLEGRHLLRDGYHRAYGFLRRGITHVPALVREFATEQEIELTGPMLPSDVFLGDRPPFLADYLNDDVAAEVEVPAVQRTVVIQALELSPTLMTVG